MAISSATIWEIRTTGADTNGGAFVSGASGTDYSQQDAKNTAGSNISTTDAVANGTSTITSASAAFTSAIVGNVIYLAGGTGSIAAGWYQVTAFTDSTTITVDRTIAASTGMTMNIGGALASPAVPFASFVAGNIAYIKFGSYSISSASTNVANGCINLTVGSDSTETAIIGYDTTRTINNQDANRPTLTASGISSATIVKVATNFSAVRVRNLIVDGASLSTITGFLSTRTETGNFSTCKAVNCTTGFSGGSALRNCLASACGTGFSTTQFALGCVASACTTFGFSDIAVASRCIACNCTGATTDGFAASNMSLSVCENCVSYSNGRHGFAIGVFSRGAFMVNCLAVNNGGYGVTLTASTAMSFVGEIIATYNNTSGAINSQYTGQVTGAIALIANPFTNAAGGDFSLNSTAGGGAACRAAGFPGVFPGISTTGYLDIGPAQHQDAGGGAALSRVFTGF